MKKIKKDNTYQKQLEEGIKNLKVELEAKSAIFKQAKENEEEIKNLKIELEAKTAIYKEQREALNKERYLSKELQTKYKELQSKYDLLSIQSYTNREKLEEAEKTIEQLKKSIQEYNSKKEALADGAEKEKQLEVQKLEKSEGARLAEQLEQFKIALKSEKDNKEELETKLEEAKGKLAEERANFEQKNLEGKAQIADLLVRLQADYPSQSDLDNARKTIREAAESKVRSQEEAEKLIEDAESEIREMKNKASQEIGELNNKIHHYIEVLEQITKSVEANSSSVTSY